MGNSIIRLLIVVFGIFCFSGMAGQKVSDQIKDQLGNISEEQAKSELEKRGYTEEEIIEILQKEGIPINNLDDIQNLEPQQIARMQEILVRLEEERNIEKNDFELDTTEFPLEEEIEQTPDEIHDNAVDKILNQFITDTLEVEDEEEIEEEIIVPIYGQSIFEEPNLEFLNQTNDLNPPDQYILGVGDEVTVSIFGRSQFEDKFKINQEGYIKILDGTKRVLLKGTTYANAKDKLFKIFRQYYSFGPGEFEVNLLYNRLINMSIYGEATQVGNFKFFPFNSPINALMVSGGPTDIGSLRNIQLIKKDGRRLPIDVYKYLKDPGQLQNLVVEDSDIILIPTQEKIITLEGAVTRPMRFELLASENLKDLLLYAGGPQDKAYLKTFELYRYDNDQQVQIDIPYSELRNSGRDFPLKNGDRIVIKSIEEDPVNFVEVSGTVLNPGKFERKNNMRVSELIGLAGLKPESRTDKALILRTELNGTKSFEWVNLNSIIENPNSADNIELLDKDVLTIWDQSRFTDKRIFSVEGSVRASGEYPYDEGHKLRVTDAIFLAGGLTRDAGDVAMIFRKDPLVPNSTEYKRINLKKILDDPESVDNVFIEGFDNILILSRNSFEKEQFISVEGAVNNPGDFLYGKNMTVADALTLAQGLKLGASTNNIEISRLEIRDNNPTKTIVATLNINNKFQLEPNDQAMFELRPYDNIYVRYVPEFEFQQEINLVGEVTYPGNYPLLDDNEKISSVIKRAGGITEEAFPAGAKLYRAQDSLGFIVLRLDEVLNNQNSKYDYILKNGDSLFIPKKLDFVVIKGATRANEVLDSTIVGSENEIKVAFHEKKNALFYINYYAGGLADDAKKNQIFVEHANGEVKKTRYRFPQGYVFPEIKRGSIIVVGKESEVKKREKENKQEVDWTKVLGDSIGQAVSILTLILLIQRLN